MMIPRIYYLQHVPFEGPGYIETWAKEKGYELAATKFYERQPLPGIDDFDCLIVMGGPMGVYDESVYPWLKSEKQFIKLAISAHKTVIGICLGAQIIAEVLGAKVYSSEEKEIGWFPVSLSPAARHNRLFRNFPGTFPALHWHGDTFDLPEGAEHIMQTEACANQAFIYGDRVLGLQFHLEASPRTLREMLDNCRHEIVPGNYIQAEKEILKRAGLCRQTNTYLAEILSGMIPAPAGRHEL